MARLLKIARSGRRHGINRARIVAAMHHAGDPVALENGTILFVGKDTGGVELEIVAFATAEDDEMLIVIHAMPTAWRRG